MVETVRDTVRGETPGKTAEGEQISLVSVQPPEKIEQGSGNKDDQTPTTSGTDAQSKKNPPEEQTVKKDGPEQEPAKTDGTMPMNHDHMNMDHDHMNMDHDHSTMDHGQMSMKHKHVMPTITGGPYETMNGIGSGTSLLPASSPMNPMYSSMKGRWMIMAHGEAKIGINDQGGPRGNTAIDAPNWVMGMASRPLAGGEFMVRGMASAEPFTTNPGGSPLLFQTGETYKGKPIVDAQHPHDMVMELGAEYTRKLSGNVSVHAYGAAVGEPALGPSAFMHRPSAAENPAPPIGHHFQDSTHVSDGVVTAGITVGKVRLEGSRFHGGEPDEQRLGVSVGALDSWSTRLTVVPTKNLSAQVSYGHLHNPEALEPGDLYRTTASITYNRPMKDGNWATTAVWGQNAEQHGTAQSFLLESQVNFKDKNYLFGRAELVDKSGLERPNIFGAPGLVNPTDDVHRVGQYSIGAVRDVVATDKARIGIGAEVTYNDVPSALQPVYGSHPIGVRAFVRIRPGKQ